jgi:hypothetical protein
MKDESKTIRRHSVAASFRGLDGRNQYCGELIGFLQQLGEPGFGDDSPSISSSNQYTVSSSSCSATCQFADELRGRSSPTTLAVVCTYRGPTPQDLFADDLRLRGSRQRGVQSNDPQGKCLGAIAKIARNLFFPFISQHSSFITYLNEKNERRSFFGGSAGPLPTSALPRAWIAMRDFDFGECVSSGTPAFREPTIALKSLGMFQKIG